MRKLAKLRIAKNMTQVDLAKAIGVSQQAISNWESGTRTPTFEKIKKLCKLFECDINDMVDLI